MSHPTVSVLMAVYNGEAYLREAIDSVLAQTFKDFEVLCIDDGSTDTTPEILAAYAARDSRVRVHRNTENLRLIASLNKAVSLARGEFLARQDDDDISLPRRFEKQVEFLRAHPDVGLLGTAYHRLFPDGRKVLRRPPADDTAIRWKMLFGNVWCHGSMMWRRALLDEESIAYGDFLHAEDYELWTRLLRRSKGATLTFPQVVYRLHEAQIGALHGGPQGEMTERISLDLLRDLLGNAPRNAELASLRRLRAPREQGATREDLRRAEWIFHAAEAFARRESLDAKARRGLEERWVRRLVREVPVRWWPSLWGTGVLRRAPMRELLRAVVVGGARGMRNRFALGRRPARGRAS